MGSWIQETAANRSNRKIMFRRRELILQNNTQAALFDLTLLILLVGNFLIIMI